MSEATPRLVMITPQEGTLLEFVRATPGLLNLLYNTDLMPEQVWNEPRRWDLMLQIIEGVRGMLQAERERIAKMLDVFVAGAEGSAIGAIVENIAAAIRSGDGQGASENSMDQRRAGASGADAPGSTEVASISGSPVGSTPG